MATQYFKDSGVKTEICGNIYHILDHFIRLPSDPIIGDEGVITFRNLIRKLEYLRPRL